MAAECAMDAAARKLQIVLKDKQREAVLSILERKDVFVILPTGYGKSMIYGVLPLAFDNLLGRKEGTSIVICISPLNSLMMDQRRAFLLRGVVAEFVGESQTDRDVVKSIVHGDVPLVLISPENIILNPLFYNMLLSQTYKERLVALVVDEAHCIKTWGSHFRTAFSRLGEVRSVLSQHVPVVAVTATSTRPTYDCIIAKLSMENVCIIGSSPDRSNIHFSVVEKAILAEFINPISKDLKEQTIGFPKTLIFCRSYNDCNIVYDQLERTLGASITYPAGFPKIHQYRMVELYTRGSTDKAKKEVLQEFMKTETHLRLVIATTAFGLGIDCPDIKRIIHWGPPHTVEEYVQESGRAGRNNEQSYATLVYNRPKSQVSPDMIEYCKNTSVCRRELLLKNFLFHDANSTKLSVPCTCCDICAILCECIACKFDSM